MIRVIMNAPITDGVQRCRNNAQATCPAQHELPEGHPSTGGAGRAGCSTTCTTACVRLNTGRGHVSASFYLSLCVCLSLSLPVCTSVPFTYSLQAIIARSRTRHQSPINCFLFLKAEFIKRFCTS